MITVRPRVLAGQTGRTGYTLTGICTAIRWKFVARKLAFGFVALLLTALIVLPGRAAAQQQTGALCVATFADSNGNGIREEGETALPGVNVNLSTAGVIILTHITAEGENQHCFENLLPGYYTITFTDSPTYRPTTSNEGTFELAGGQRLTINDFGAVPIPLSNLRAEVAAQVAAARSEDEPLDTSVRLLLATVGSMVVMIFMIGVGAVIMGLQRGGRDGKRPRQQGTLPPPPPTQIAPPPGSR
jgi:hypothetical protein